MQAPLKLDIWLQSYEQFIKAENNIKQKNLNSFFANISKTLSATSDSFPLIMSQMCLLYRFKGQGGVKDKLHKVLVFTGDYAGYFQSDLSYSNC